MSDIPELVLPKASPRGSDNDRLGDPWAIDTICGHVANGGNIISLAKLWGLEPGRIIGWIKSDKNRAERYAIATTERKELAAEALTMHIQAAATSDLREVFDEDGNMRPPNEWPDNIARAIQSVEVFEEFGQLPDGTKASIGTTKKIKLWDKPKSIELLGKLLGEFKEKPADPAQSFLSIVQAALQLRQARDLEHAQRETTDNGSKELQRREPSSQDG